MILSPDQVKTFWSLWAKACRARGWTREAGLSAAQIDAKRKELLRACGFDSLTRVDRVNGFTKVKNELIVLVGESVRAGIEAEDQSINKARTLRHFIRTNLLRCLALYVDLPEKYLQSIITDVTRWNKIDRPGVPATLDDLDARPILKTRNGVPHESPSLLNQVIMTLSARIQSKRKAAGDSLHDMRTRAGLECNCKQCRTPARRVFYMPPQPVLATDNEPF